MLFTSTNIIICVMVPYINVMRNKWIDPDIRSMTMTSKISYPRTIIICVTIAVICVMTFHVLVVGHTWIGHTITYKVDDITCLCVIYAWGHIVVYSNSINTKNIWYKTIQFMITIYQIYYRWDVVLMLNSNVNLHLYIHIFNQFRGWFHWDISWISCAKARNYPSVETHVDNLWSYWSYISMVEGMCFTVAVENTGW